MRYEPLLSAPEDPYSLLVDEKKIKQDELLFADNLLSVPGDLYPLSREEEKEKKIKQKNISLKDFPAGLLQSLMSLVITLDSKQEEKYSSLEQHLQAVIVSRKKAPGVAGSVEEQFWRFFLKSFDYYRSLPDTQENSNQLYLQAVQKIQQGISEETLLTESIITEMAFEEAIEVTYKQFCEQLFQPSVRQFFKEHGGEHGVMVSGVRPGYLTLADTLRLTLVCKRFYLLVAHSPGDVSAVTEISMVDKLIDHGLSEIAPSPVEVPLAIMEVTSTALDEACAQGCCPGCFAMLSCMTCLPCLFIGCCAGSFYSVGKRIRHEVLSACPGSQLTVSIPSNSAYPTKEKLYMIFGGKPMVTKALVGDIDPEEVVIRVK